MIQHIVMLALPDNHDPQSVADIMDALKALVGDIPGFTAFSHGPNRDFECKSPGWPYGFICSFQNRAALQAYATDPRHRAQGAKLVALCSGGADGIMVLDIDCT